MSQPDLRERAERCYDKIAALVSGPVSLMEVCGTHTMAISRFGIRARVPETLRLLSGPGCPVCVTPASQIDHLMAMAREPGVIVTTFGDMLRVPGSKSSLEQERTRGSDIRVVYSPHDAMEIARAAPDRIVVFMGVGFETTSPTIAATMIKALAAGIGNFCVYPAFKVVPPAMDALVASGETRIDGFICPGHVSTIIGSAAYEPIARDRKVPCVVTGFEALDVLEGVILLLEQRAAGKAEVQVQYRRAVSPEGNRTALDILSRTFTPCDAAWRGIGVIPGTGLEPREEFLSMDARRRVQVEMPKDAVDLPAGCGCGEVMRGLKVPTECAMFGTACTPSRPIGPCMVSTEGACAAWYRYGRG
ncbi:MAG: hydrogenase formation protein HypD [Deltaproteobacteria bacterium]|nr:hydrogenase formation protein HypD [Deltaproteobacteria bacterium]